MPHRGISRDSPNRVHTASTITRSVSPVTAQDQRPSPDSLSLRVSSRGKRPARAAGSEEAASQAHRLSDHVQQPLGEQAHHQAGRRQDGGGDSHHPARLMSGSPPEWPGPPSGEPGLQHHLEHIHRRQQGRHQQAAKPTSGSQPPISTAARAMYHLLTKPLKGGCPSGRRPPP